MIRSRNAWRIDGVTRHEISPPDGFAAAELLQDNNKQLSREFARLPFRDTHNAGYVAFLRYVQSIHEPTDRRNPDTLVRRFFSPLKRLHTRVLLPAKLQTLRADPFYYYLLARTRHYDTVFCDASSGALRAGATART